MLQPCLGEIEEDVKPERGSETENVIEHRATDASSDMAHMNASIEFHITVLNWLDGNARDFPWRGTSNPFHILVAEVLLRQTQAHRVVEPYFALIERYPTPEACAQAEPSALTKLFRPLGLYRRADSLIEASSLIVDQHGGCVPTDLDTLLSLPGIGEYSARAILSMAFRVPVPMVDESSGRLYRRVWGLPKRGPAYNDRTVLEMAERLIPSYQSREFNLGILDIAAAYCHVRKPICRACPLASSCTYRSATKNC